ncbi:MAG: AsmA-like C-terminal region-containing protein [Myxococcota bacterium]
MRRNLVLVAIGLAVFTCAASVGFLVSARLLPERVREITERSLGELLGTSVAVEETQLYLSFGLAVEGRGITAWPGPDGPALSVRRAILQLDLLPLLLGRIEPRRLRFEAPRLQIERDPDGRIVAPFAWSPGAADPERPAYELGRNTVDAAVTALLALPLPAPRLEIRDGGLTVLRAGDPEAAALVLRDLDARVSRDTAGEAGRVQLETELVRGGRDGGRLNLHAEADRDRGTRVRLHLEQFELAALAAWAPPLGRRLGLGGRATGHLELRMEADKPHRLDADLALSRFSFRLARPGASPLAGSSERGSLQAAFLLSESRLELWSGRMASGKLSLGLEGTLELPVGPNARVRLVARAPELALGDLRDGVGWLPEAAREDAEAHLARVEAGDLRNLELRVATSLGSFGTSPEERLALVRDLELRGRLEGAVLRISESSRLGPVAATVLFDGDRLDLRRVSAEWKGTQLPGLEASITGLSHLLPAGEIRCPATAQVAPLPGRRALQDWLDARRNPELGPSWSRLTLEADWVRHPVLLCGLDHAQATLAPTEGGFSFELQQGIWAGAPIKARGVFRSRPSEILNLTVALGPAWEPVSEVDPDGPWASGRFVLDGQRFGPWRIRGSRGGFQLRDDELQLLDARLDLLPRGELRADLALNLADPEAVPYRLDFTVENGSIADLAESLDRDGTLAEGTLTAAGVLGGRLRAAESPFAEAAGTLVAMARDGELHRQLPPVLAIALASEFNPVADREVIPYDGIDAVLELDGGVLRTESLTLRGPWLRALASGEVDLVHPPHPAESVVALFFFRNLDNMISKLPLLNRVLLGEDENLINAYFALSGPLGKPQARLIPVKTLSAGPASFVLEGFPAFVRGGLSRLRSVLLPGDEAADPMPRSERIGS